MSSSTPTSIRPPLLRAYAMSELVSQPVTVRAPATSANLGPGFDAFGLALDLHDEVEVAITGRGLEIEVQGEGATTVPRDESHAVVRALRATLDMFGVSQPGLRLVCRNVIPHGRGLGSSAAAIVSGIRLAESLVDGGELSESDLLGLATGLEGHPDNVAACLFGGFTIAWSDNGNPRLARLDVHPELTAVVFVPPEPLSTEVARGLLPRDVSHGDASANAGRAALLVAAMIGRPDLLLPATEDRLHQRYRGSAMPDSIALLDGLRESGIAAVVSGAGPSVLAIDTSSRPLDADAWIPAGWAAHRFAIEPNGAVAGRVS
jgi:homoserine kinase